MHRWQAVVLSGMVAMTLGCNIFPTASPSAATSLMKGTPNQVRDRLLGQIPIGTSQIDAERLLKSLGLEKTPSFELGSESDDFIRCRHTARKGLLGEVTWLIQIEFQDGAVTDIICEQIEIGS